MSLILLDNVYVTGNFVFLYFKGTEIERLKKAHGENQSRGQLGRLADELQGVQRIMIDNIDAALNRGELISGNAN